MKGVSDELSKVRNKNYKELLFMVFIAHVVSVERCGEIMVQCDLNYMS